MRCRGCAGRGQGKAFLRETLPSSVYKPYMASRPGMTSLQAKPRACHPVVGGGEPLGLGPEKKQNTLPRVSL